MVPGHQIDCFNRRIMAQTALQVLAETGTLAMKTQRVWWSLQGLALALLTTTLEGQRQDLLDAMTSLARRMTALGSYILVDNATLLAHARTVAPQPAHAPVRNMVRQLSQEHQKVQASSATSAASRLEDLALRLDEENELLRLNVAPGEILDPAG